MDMRRPSWLLLLSCLLIGSAATAQLPQTSYDLEVDDCNAQAFVCTEISDADFASLTVYIDGVEQTAPRVACNEDTVTAYSLSSFNGDGYGGPFEIFEWLVNGLNTVGTFGNPNELLALMNASDPAGNWQLDLVNNRVYGGVSSNTYSDLEVFCQPLVANQVSTKQVSMQGGGSRFGFDEGSHTIEVHDAGGLIDAANVVVTCTAQPTAEYVALYIPTAVTVCPDLGGLSGPVDQFSLSPQPTVATVALGANDCFVITPRAVGVETIRITYCDAANNCSQQDYILDVELGTQITSTTIYDTVPAPGSVVTYCIDTLELPGTVVSVVNACPEASGTFVNMDLVEETVCLKYRGLTVGGTDTACVVVCDDLGFCDTTTVIVTTIEPNEYPDQELEFTIEEGTVSSTVLDVSRFVSPLAGLENTCESLSGTFVRFRVEPDNYSVDFTGLLPGTERACVDVTDIEGRTQTFNITVNVTSRAAAADTLRIRNGDSRTWCFGPYELTADPQEMYDDCLATNPRASIAFTNDISCWEITGNSVGNQRMCVTLCDGFGICDRINLIVQVVPNDDDRLPLAVDDYVVVDPSTPSVLDVLANDSSLEPLTFTYVYSQPQHGSASFNGGVAIDYVTDAGYCGNDTLLYEICNSFGCDQAEVVIVNDCEGTATKPAIINRSGFSPNNDGVNETWTLTNIEYYPGNTVKVYNRWGSRVMEAQGYDNSWTGDFDGQPLPDGTYFFIVDPGEPGVEPVAGYVHLSR